MVMLDRTKRVWRWVYPCVVVFSIIVGAGVAGVLFQRANTNESNISVLIQQTADDKRAIDQLATKLEQANTRLETNGLAPVIVPTTIPSPERGQRGDAGADATDAQVDRSVAEFCLAHANCAGAPGKDSTTAGPKGDKGDTGDPGADSTVPGPVGGQGPAGVNAPTVISIQCLDDGNGQFTFSDMSIIVVPNMCQTTPTIPEIPTPEEATP